MIKKVYDVKKSKEIIILKLGGGLITDKNKPFSLREEVIENSVHQIIRSKKKVIVIHGGGSFGHPTAQEYQINKGKDPSIANQIYGLTKTHDVMVKLNSIIIEKFLKQNVASLSIQTSSIFVKDSSKDLFSCNFEPIIRCLSLGIIPVIYGDIVFDLQGDFSILSGDKIILLLCQYLKEFFISKVIFAVEVEGIFIYNKDMDIIELAEEIKCSKLDSLPLANLDKKIDVTGGIKGKLDNIHSICKLGIPVQLINGKDEEKIYKCLINKEVKGTSITI
ncbi:MAG: Isopentenyl phosphate kinase [Promethearchaeota archaeon]|nr:MAG: Isopentenyl phosphate kinase [Candidatus Lokiarchaeota archaeon]